jgi:BCD family chlorophyll transporter-like MFS transporter
MNPVSRKAMDYWVSAGMRFLPFADAATVDLPLSRLLRLSLFQVAVGMALTLLVGTLNRVMIVELGVPASLVGVMIAMPLVFAPFRALIGFRSDHHRSALGWKRVPFIFRGSMVQFGGLAIMPFALLVLSGGGDAARVPGWVGCAAAALAFLLTGAGLHTIQTAGLALATDLAPPESQPQVVGLMYVMLLIGMMASALLFGAILADFSPYRLIQVIQAAALATLVLNSVAVWKQEGRGRYRPAIARPGFSESWARFCQGGQARRRLLAIGLGTMAFSMEDVLLEPYGGQILHLAVGETTRLTATLALGGLCGFWLASRILGRGFDPFRMAGRGAMVGIVAFAAVILAGPCGSLWLFAGGTYLIGFGAGLFGHGTLTATMRLAPRDQAGLALGAWGAVQATAAGLAIALGGILRDAIAHALPAQTFGAAAGYDFVYSLEVCLLFATLLTMIPLITTSPASASDSPKPRHFSKGFFMRLARLYHSTDDAAAAVNDLVAAGFDRASITVVDQDAGYISAETISDRGIVAAHAPHYAAAVKAGGVLVTLSPALGLGARATAILEQTRPADTGPVTVQDQGAGWDPAAPLSSALFMPVKLDNPAPFSSLWNVPAVTKKGWFVSSLLGLKMLSDNPAPLSGAIGLKTLASHPAPFSALLKLPTLIGK